MNNPQEKLILLLDDSAAHRTLVKRALLKAGLLVKISELSSLRAGLELLQDKDQSRSVFNLVIVDLNLGDGRGSEFVKEMRRHPNLKTTPTIIISTSGLEHDIEESYHSGANCYVLKSENMSKFSDEIAAAVKYFASS